MTYEALFAETVLMRGHQCDQIDAYLARPVGAGPHGGVVIIHHMFHTYDNAGHAFFAVDRPNSRQAAAVDGWERVLAWLEKHLR